MNNKIKEIMEQAGFDPASIERMGVMPQADKFVELFINENARLIDMWSDSGRFETFGQRLKAHFTDNS